jgi:hypothetical protein
MIIGEQRVSENYYENTHQFEALKRKLSSENENDLSNYSEVVKNCSSSANTSKMQYVDNIITADTYHTYQTTAEQIHHDGKQSYINLTVMTPSLVHYDKNQVNCQVQEQPQQQQLTFTNSVQENHQSNKQQQQQTTTTANISKYEVKNYHQSGTRMCRRKSTHKTT